MAALVWQVGTFDLAACVRAQPEEGMDPTGSGAHIKRLFAGSTALADGTVSVGEAVDNRVLAAPLWLNASTPDGVLTQLSQLKAACVKGAQIQFRAEGTSQISYLDLQSADIAEHFSHWYLKAGWMKVDVKLYAGPRASTGTTRTVATMATIPALGELSVPSIGGDVTALGNVHFGGGGVDAHGNPCLLGFAYHKSASAVGHWRAASIVTTTASSPLVGASGAFASQYLAVPIAPTGSIDVTVKPAAAALPAGRYRLLALARSRISTPSGGVVISAAFNSGISGGGTARLAGDSFANWHLLDLGEFSALDPITVASVAAFPTISVKLTVSGASGASLIASPGFHIAAMTMFPLDYSAALHQTLTSNLIDYDYSFLSYPTVVNVQKSLGALVSPNDINPRGVPLTPPPSSASYPAGKLITVAGDPTNFLAGGGGVNNLSVQVDVRERFAYLR